MKLTQAEGKWFCSDLNRAFSRVVGGLSLPTSQPGAAAIVGEEYIAGPEQPRFFVLAEREDFNADELLQWCEVGASIPLDWMVSVFNQTGQNVIHSFNERQIPRHRPAISFMGAPGSSFDNIVWHLNIIRQNQGRLIFPEASIVQAKMEVLEEDSFDMFKESLNPAAAALGFCVAFLVTMPPDDYDGEDWFESPPAVRGADRVTGY